MKVTRGKYKIVIILSTTIIGVSTIVYSLLQKGNKVSNFSTGKTTITIINLKDKNELNYLLFAGFFLLTFSLVLLLVEYFYKPDMANFDKKNKLTQKENEVLILIKKGYSNKDISNELFISVSTVKTHVNNIFKKKNVTKREHLMSQKTGK